jgi:chemotaxis response regulator CheB
MPGMQGPDVVRELQALDPTISVVMVSGTDDEDLARELLKAGALDYVRKPFALEALREVVQVAVLTGKRPRPAAAKPPRGRHAGGAGPSPAEALDGRCPICGEAVATTDTAAVCDGGAMFRAGRPCCRWPARGRSRSASAPPSPDSAGPAPGSRPFPPRPRAR